MPEKIDLASFSLALGHDYRASTVALRAGPPARPDGISIGVVDVTGDPPHGGEMHPDGDEILLVLSGVLEIRTDDEPSIRLEAGEGCVVPKGVWHRVKMIEPAKLIHITPGPNGDHRPMGDPRLDAERAASDDDGHRLDGERQATPGTLNKKLPGVPGHLSFAVEQLWDEDKK